MRAVGNIVDGKHIAGLMFASQQAANAGSGAITKIDYDTGDIQVDTGDPAHPAIVRINDPNGRFGRAAEPRRAVQRRRPEPDRSTPAPATRCACRGPTRRRPTTRCARRSTGPSRAGAARHCRNFSDAGVAPLPGSGELSAAAGHGRGLLHEVRHAERRRPARPRDPDPRQQAPFEVGDHITSPARSMHDGSGDYISAHTIEANVGIYTQPGTQPSYLAIGEFGVGSADPNATAVSGVAQETQDRIFLEAETTDVKTPVDIYLMDVDPAHRGRQEPLGHALGDDRREPGRQPDAAASRRSSPAPSRSAPGCGRRRRRPGC